MRKWFIATMHSKTIVAGSHVHLNLLVVLLDQAGLGIAQNLVRISVENAAQYGYQIAIVEANGPASEHISEKPLPVSLLKG